MIAGRSCGWIRCWPTPGAHWSCSKPCSGTRNPTRKAHEGAARNPRRRRHAELGHGAVGRRRPWIGSADGATDRGRAEDPAGTAPGPVFTPRDPDIARRRRAPAAGRAVERHRQPRTAHGQQPGEKQPAAPHGPARAAAEPAVHRRDAGLGHGP